MEHVTGWRISHFRGVHELICGDDYPISFSRSNVLLLSQIEMHVVVFSLRGNRVRALLKSTGWSVCCAMWSLLCKVIERT